MADTTNQQERAHADAGFSGAERYMACPASVTKARGKFRPSTIYSRKGTFLHELSEIIIHGQPIPDTIQVEDDVFDVTPEDIEIVTAYTRYAEILRDTADRLYIEERVTLDYFYPNGMPEPVFSHLDLGAYQSNGGHPILTLADLKGGRGYLVSAENNAQLRGYALALLGRVLSEGLQKPETIRLVIVQPHDYGSPIKSETITCDELLEWFRDELDPALRRLAANDQTESAGKWCRWCARAGECHALTRTAMETARLAFAAAPLPAKYTGGGAVSGGKEPPEPTELSNDDLAAILDKAEIIESWIEKVRATASNRIDHGQRVPGWKLVAKRAQRKWADAEKAEKALMMQAPISEIFTRKLKSPAQAEALLKTKAMTKEGIAVFLAPLVSKESSGTTLVPADDPRPAVDTSAAAAFAANPIKLGSK